MKKIIFIAFFAVSILFILSCKSGTTNSQNHLEMQKNTSEVYYTCTMHPEVHSDKPGDCPKCGMKLIKKEVTETDSTFMKHSSDSIQ